MAMFFRRAELILVWHVMAPKEVRLSLAQFDVLFGSAAGLESERSRRIPSGISPKRWQSRFPTYCQPALPIVAKHTLVKPMLVSEVSKSGWHESLVFFQPANTYTKHRRRRGLPALPRSR